jgi:putative redox protein
VGQRRSRPNREVSQVTEGTTHSSAQPNGSAAGTPKREARIELTWAGEHRFDTGRPGGPTARFDGDGATGQSPVDGLLSALAACSAADVVDILAKRRTPVERLRVEVRGERREEFPRRFTHIELRYIVDGAGIDAPHVERAIALSHEKYCSVGATLDPALAISSVAVVNGVEGELRTGSNDG